MKILIVLIISFLGLAPISSADNPWTSKPSKYEIEWGSPISKYIAGAWIFNQSGGGAISRSLVNGSGNIITNVGGAAFNKGGIAYDGAAGTRSTITGGTQNVVELYMGEPYWLCIRFKAYSLDSVIYGQALASAGSYSKRIFLNGTNNRIDFYMGGGVSASTPTNSISIGKWHTILFTATNGSYNEKVHIYLDDRPLVSSNYGTNCYDGGETPYLGDSYDNQPFNGTIDYFLSFKNPKPSAGTWTTDKFGKFIRENLVRDPYCFLKQSISWTNIPQGAGQTSFIKTINGLSINSVKTVNGLAKASMKTYNGLA